MVEPEGQLVAAGGSHFQHAINLLSRRTGRSQRLAQAAIVGAAAWEIGTKAWKRANSELQYTVAIPSTDDVYDDVHAWLLASMPSKRRKALTARSGFRTPYGDPPTSVMDDTKRVRPVVLRLFYDGSTTQTVTLDGHRVRVGVEQDMRERHRSLSADDMRSWFQEPEKIVFTCRGESARDAVLEFVRTIAQSKVEATTTRFYIADRWGNWNRRNDLSKRPLATVILRDGQQERLVADLTEFLAAEPKYARIGLPWHRGYLLHGPPGTGKTSLARALAEHFELDVHYIPLSDIKADTNLLQLLSGIGPRSMLVLEDLDVVHASRSRDDAEGGERVSMSGLLNALDGFATPHGLVTVMTTNCIDVLDPAIVRAGRADLVEELGYLDNDQLARLIDLVCGWQGAGAATAAGVTLVADIVGSAQITHAEVVEAAKTHLDDGDAALAAITDHITRRRDGTTVETFGFAPGPPIRGRLEGDVVRWSSGG